MSSQAAPIARERDASIKVGERAPQFTLKTANAAGGRSVGDIVALAEMLARGPVIVEFLRGTW